MRSPFCFVAEPVDGKRYDSISKSGLFISASQEDHKTTSALKYVIEGLLSDELKKYQESKGKTFFGKLIRAVSKIIKK